MNRLTTRAMVLCAALSVAITTGCIAVVFAAGAAAGVSGAVWYHGELRTSLAGTLPQVRDAASAALEKMGKGVSPEESGPLKCTLISYTGDDRKITIELTSLSSDVTEVHIRVGFWGDQTLSRVILVQISDRLGKPAAAATPSRPAYQAP
jgi:hypothetical protein